MRCLIHFVCLLATFSTIISNVSADGITREDGLASMTFEEFPCPPDIPQVYVQHPDDCSAFYLCRSGVFQGIFNCPAGLWFSSRGQGCVPPEESDCTGQPPVTTTSTSQPPKPTTDPPVETTSADRFPCPPGVPQIYVQHPDDCSAFYLCRSGVFQGILNCPGILWFHSGLQSCVFPEESDCTIGGTSQPPQPTTEPPVETTSADRFPCPAGVPQVYVQHPDDCNAFYLCRSGAFQGIFNCPGILWFHSGLQSCVFPEDSDCTVGGTDEPPVTTTSTTTSQLPQPTTEPPVKTTSADRFPCPPDIPHVYVQHPDDCNAFYLCRSGVFQGIFNCPPVLWFHSKIQSCDYPENSDCTVGGTDVPPVTTTTTISQPPKPTTEPPVETTSADRFPCPPDIPQVYVQHPEDCNAFYLCRSGVFQGTFNCPAGLWFSTRLQGCVNPGESDCTA